MTAKLHAVKLISRVALGLVWFYEGLVPKILFLRADEINLVQASNLVWRTPGFTLQLLGAAQMLVGLWLIIGIAERSVVLIATLWMLILVGIVARGLPAMLTDPYGALVKDFCLIACAITVWMLAPAKYRNPYPDEDKISSTFKARAGSSR
jgi:DoxX-like family